MLKPAFVTVTFAAAFCCAAAPAHAAGATLDCAKAQTQVDMNTCADQDYQRADKKLNELYKKLQARDAAAGEAQQKTSLRDAQRAWIKFRDSECAYETIGFEGGSIEPLVHASCMAELTDQRNQTLQRLLNNPD